MDTGKRGRSSFWPHSYYRVRQFFRGLVAKVPPAELTLVRQLLPAEAYALFLEMPTDAQRHSLNVLHTLHKARHEHSDLSVAALLHDVGKIAADRAGVQLGLWLRGPLVLLEATAPQLLARWAHDDPAIAWRYLLYVNAAHPEIGATWAKEAGCSACACWLIAQHQRPAGLARQRDPAESTEWQELLLALQWADGMN